MSWFWWVVAIVLGLFLVGGSVLAYTTHRRFTRAVFVEGSVVELVPRPNQKGTGATYSARVSYKTLDGKTHTFVSNSSSNPPSYSLRATLLVAYDPASSQATIATFGECFGVAVVLLCLGLLGTLLTTAFVVGARYVPAAYMRSGNG